MRYILRAGASEQVITHGVPEDAITAAAWINAQERTDRSNARVCDKILLALPHQLSSMQRAALVQAYCVEMSRGVPYIAALHHPSRDGDQRNHHAHVVFRDRDPITGKRVMGTSERGSVERFRERWEHHVNSAMADAGLDGRTDRRSHAARGLDRTPGLHAGPAATNAARREVRGGTTPAGHASSAAPLHSQAQQVRNGVGAHNAERVVDYALIDGGRTRAEENVRRAAANARADRTEAQAALAARLDAARAGMAVLGLGAAPASHEAPHTGRSAPVRPRDAAAHASPAAPTRAAPGRHVPAPRTGDLVADPMPLTRDAWDEAAATARAHQRIAAVQARLEPAPDLMAAQARELGHRARVAAGVQNYKHQAAAAAQARAGRAASVAADRLAQAAAPRQTVRDTAGPIARRVHAAAAQAAQERLVAEAAARTRLASAHAARQAVPDTMAAVARRSRVEAVQAAQRQLVALEARQAAREVFMAAHAPRAPVTDPLATAIEHLRAQRAAQGPARVVPRPERTVASRVLADSPVAAPPAPRQAVLPPSPAVSIPAPAEAARAAPEAAQEDGPDATFQRQVLAMGEVVHIGADGSAYVKPAPDRRPALRVLTLPRFHDGPTVEEEGGPGLRGLAAALAAAGVEAQTLPPRRDGLVTVLVDVAAVAAALARMGQTEAKRLLARLRQAARQSRKLLAARSSRDRGGPER